MSLKEITDLHKMEEREMHHLQMTISCRMGGPDAGCDDGYFIYFTDGTKIPVTSREVSLISMAYRKGKKDGKRG